MRVAFGASRGRILQMVIGHGLKLSVAGVVGGVLVAVALTRLIASLLVGVRPTDPLTFSLTALAFFAIATIACMLPGLRASRMDPTVALREH